MKNEEHKAAPAQPEAAHHPVQAPTKTNTLAIWGFILAILLPLIGLILSIIAISQIKKSNEGGKGLAIAGIVIASILLFFQLIIFVSLVNGAKNISTTTSSDKSSQSSSSNSGSKPAEVAKIGQAVRDGKFEFTVTGFSCGQTSVGTNQYLTKQAQGQFCMLNLSIKNIGDQAQSLFSGNQKLLNGSTQYSADDTATLYAGPSGSTSTWFNDINPGNSVSGTIVFDVPKGVTPTQAELHDSAFSGGIKVNLQ
jgi:hypothetical protein